MAPPMFNYIRSHHRKSGSSPPSVSPQSIQWPSPSPLQWFESVDSPASPQYPGYLTPHIESPVSLLPPVLPPILRVTSQAEHDDIELQDLYDIASLEERNAGRLSRQGSRIAKTRIREPLDSRPFAGYHDEPPVLPLLPYKTLLEQQERTSSTLSQSIRREYEEKSGGQTLRQEPQNFHSPVRETARSWLNTQDDSLSTKRSLTGPSAESQGFAQGPVIRSSPPVYIEQPAPTSQSSHVRPSSPSLSFSSYHQTLSSTNLISELSPASSHSLQSLSSTTPRISKSKMNMLNPMSLLLRRRTPHAKDNLNDESLVGHRTTHVPAMSLPMGYDPRIKGKGVHDFNAPRQRRNFSTNDLEGTSAQVPDEYAISEDQKRRRSIPFLSPEDTMSGSITPSRQRSPEKEHTPQFFEHFEDDADDEGSSSAVQRESLANSSFLARMSKQLNYDSPDMSHFSHTPPLEPRPSTPKHEQRESKSTTAVSVRDSTDRSTVRSSISNETKATSPSQSPPKQSSTSLILDTPLQTFELPNHFSSTASRTSRFSFQLNSDRSKAEEKALEEKHKQMNPPEIANGDVNDSDGDNLSEYGDMDNVDYEEAIPGVNVDPEEVEVFQAQVVRMSRATSTARSVDSRHKSRPPSAEQDGKGTRSLVQGLGLIGLKDLTALQVPPVQPTLQPLRRDTKSSVRTDDMYFDDGMIFEPGLEEHSEFDESVFDSPTKFIYEPRAIDKAVLPPANGDTARTHEQTSLNEDHAVHSQRSNDVDAEYQLNGRLSGNANIKQAVSSSQSLGCATMHEHGKLDAYHSALASAATQAAVDGKFHRRQASNGTDASEAGELYYNEAPDWRNDYYGSDGGTIAPTDWTRHNKIYHYGEDDDDLEEDPMIAAANAEALAADESGFYGQEFDFYGSANPNSSESFNGGFFGSPPADALRRSKSGRDQDANLTPITERSEFSTRNSYISLSAYGAGMSNVSTPRERETSIPLPDPGLKEIAASIGLDDEELTLSQLLKLRKEAFGTGGSGPGSAISTVPLTSGRSLLAVRTGLPVASQSETDSSPLGDVGEESEDEYASSTSSSPTVTIPGKTRLWEYQARPAHSSANNAVVARENTRNNPAPLVAGSQRRQTLSSSTYQTYFPPPSSLQAVPGAMSMPSPSQLSTFAFRPPASSASYAKQQPPQQSRYSQQEQRTHSDSVTYVQEDIPNSEDGSPVMDDGASYFAEESGSGNRTRWYLEKRRTMSTGEVVMLGRELVEGGRI